MKITKKNFATLFIIIIVLSLAHSGIVSVLGFDNHWNIFRKVAFPIINAVLLFIPLALFMKFYQKMNP